MKKAIVTGAGGFLGQHLVDELLSQGIPVLAIHRQDKFDICLSEEKSEMLIPCQLGLDQIDKLPERMRELEWTADETICFFHLAWKGDQSIADGGGEAQAQNIPLTAQCLIEAARLGCGRFVQVGSVEENYIEDFLESGRWLEQPYYSGHGFYAAAKAGAFKMNMLLAYLEKIDYVHTRFSVTVSKDLERFHKGFIAQSIREILKGGEAAKPASSQLYELIEVSELAKALVAVARKGKNKREYYLGAGTPKTLKRIFAEIADQEVAASQNPASPFARFFDPASFKSDIGYLPKPLIGNDFL